MKLFIVATRNKKQVGLLFDIDIFTVTVAFPVRNVYGGEYCGDLFDQTVLFLHENRTWITGNDKVMAIRQEVTIIFYLIWGRNGLRARSYSGQNYLFSLQFMRFRVIVIWSKYTNIHVDVM